MHTFMLLIALVVLFSGCATNVGLPQCKGPAVPINADLELQKDEAR